MIPIKVFSNIYNNITKFADNFIKTKDFNWIIRSAQEQKLLKDIGTLVPATVKIKHLIKLLQDSERVADRDFKQTVVNEATAAALIKQYSKLDPETPVLKIESPSSPAAAYTTDVVRYNKQEVLEDIVSFIKSDRELSEKIKARLISTVDPGQNITNVLSILYPQVYNLLVYLKPILYFIGSEQLNKTAAEKPVKIAPSKRGPRLSDLIEANRLASGNYAIEIIRLNRALNSGAVYGQDTKTVRSSISQLKKRMIILDAYVDWLVRAQAALSDFIASNPKNEWKKFDVAGDFITSNPYISSLEKEPSSFSNFIRPSINKAISGVIPIKKWDGTLENLTNFKPPQEDIAVLYSTFRVQDIEYNNQISINIRNNIKKAKEYNNQIYFNSRILRLGKLFPSLEIQELLNIDNKIKAMIVSSIPAIPDEVKDEFEEDADNVKFLTQQGADPSVASKIYQNAFNQSIENVILKLLSTYSSSSIKRGKEFESEIRQIVSDMLDKEIEYTSPLDVIYLKTLDYQIAEDNKFVSANIKSLFPDVYTILKSEPFKTKYIYNEEEMTNYEDAHKDKINPVVLNISAGVAKLKTPEGEELLNRLGFSTKILTLIEALPRTIQPWSISKDNEIFINEFNINMKLVFSRNKAEIQAILGDIPIEALYAYVGTLFTEAMEAHILCKIVCRFSRVSVGEEYTEVDDE